MEYSHRFSDKELFETFPDCLETICDKIFEFENERHEILAEIDLKLEFIQSVSDRENIPVYEELVKHFDIDDLDKVETNLNRLRRLLAVASGHQAFNTGIISDEKIQEAKSFPLELIFRDITFRASGKSLKGLCPFHTEKTPSFYIYPVDNHFYCFGCGMHGDAINAQMHLTGCSFKEAVVRLLGETLL